MTGFLGTRSGLDNYETSLPGFTQDDGKGGPNERALSWYAGTTNLGLSQYRQDTAATQPIDPIYRRRGDGHYQALFDRDFAFSGTSNPRINPWYIPKHQSANFSLNADTAPWEGIGTGWFYSVLGGGKDLRPTSSGERVPLTFDNTLEARMRGDAVVPTLFNGNFDALFNPRSSFRNSISTAIPGWAFHEDGTSTIDSPTSQLVNWKDITTLANYRTQLGYNPAQPNYALELKSGDTITHNRFVMPEWGTLRFDLHAPNLNGGTLTATLQGEDGSSETETIRLEAADGPYSLGYNDNDTYRIGYGSTGFETFHINVPESLRGKVATIKFEVNNGTVYLDDVFFKSKHLLPGNPILNGQEARPGSTNYANNYLIEKPQYSLSYNESKKGPNWVSWQLNKTWLGNVPRPGSQNAPAPPDYPGDPLDYPWLPDSALPSSLKRTNGPDYRDSGFERGHMAPNADRDRTQKDQFATFLTTNLLPQHPQNNRPGTAWAKLENFSRDLVKKGNKELYLIAGGAGSANDAYPGNRLNSEGINIPEATWKVIVALEPGQSLADISTSTPVIGVVTPNSSSPQVPDITEWSTWTRSVDYIETLTGLDLLSNLPDEIEQVIEAEEYSGPTTV